jgi:hypothetical protein
MRRFKRFDKYRPKFEVALLMALIAAVAIAALLLFEVERPRVSHQAQAPSAQTQTAAKEAGARVTPSNPDETKPLEPGPAR